MPFPAVITKRTIEEALSRWGSGQLSNRDIHCWAMDNYFPTQRIAPGEPLHIGFAAGTILAVFDQAREPCDHLNAAGWKAALAFLNTSAALYRTHEAAFFKECFAVVLGPPSLEELERYRRHGIPID